MEWNLLLMKCDDDVKDNEKLKTKEKIKTNVNDESEPSEKKGLFGWFKKKK